MRRFLGFSNAASLFIPNFEPLAARLNETLIKDQPKDFGHLDEKESAAVESLRKTFISSLVFVLLRMTASTQLVPMLVVSRSGVYFFRSRKMGVTTLLAVVLLL